MRYRRQCGDSVCHLTQQMADSGRGTTLCTGGFVERKHVCLTDVAKAEGGGNSLLRASVHDAAT